MFKWVVIVLFDVLGCDGVVWMDFFFIDWGFVLNEVNMMLGLIVVL